MLENKTIKTSFKKEELFDNINLLEESEIRVPEIIYIILKLKQKGIHIDLRDFTIDEIINKIVEVCK